MSGARGAAQCRSRVRAGREVSSSFPLLAAARRITTLGRERVDVMLDRDDTVISRMHAVSPWRRGLLSLRGLLVVVLAASPATPSTSRR